MEQNDNSTDRYERRGNSRIWSGLILLTAGVLLLVYKMGAPIPGWIFTWPVLLIAIGFLAGAKSRFHNPGAFILIIIGTIFLIDQTNPSLNFHNYILPIILIAVGLVYILRPRHTFGRRPGRRCRQRQWDRSSITPPEFSTVQQENAEGQNDDAEYVEINAIFSGVKKNILSKNFKGGTITSFMGGTELNLLKADIQKPILLEVNNIFGGTKLIVPSNWDVKNEVTAIFGGIEDKRALNGGQPDPEKVIVLKGACIFGGIEVANY